MANAARGWAAAVMMPRLAACLLALAGLAPSAVSAQVIELRIDGPIGPATSNYVASGLEQAAAENAPLVLLSIDTPGGLDTAMREIVQAILASPVPVAGYVTPGGARAASAGTYILYASHVAAMAPATNLGAATPVQMGGGGPLPGGGKEPDDKASDGEKSDTADSDTAKRRKVINDSVAYLRGLAEQRGRNADWAEQAVREGTSLTASAALEQNVIDLVATSRQGLLAEIDGMEVTTSAGTVTLATADAAIDNREPDWRDRLLAIITNPTVAYILMMIGIYGLILEGYNPGALVPGTVGGICLLVALFAFQILPVNFAGLALLALGIALMVAEAFAPSFGILGLGGVVGFVVGSIMLMDTGVPGYEIPLAIIGATATAAALLMFLIVYLFARSHRGRVVTGREGLIGATARASEDFDQRGWVLLHGESWQATTTTPIRTGQTVTVTGVDGLVVSVTPDNSDRTS
ncbi:nodulation protein NfeD [Spectribacter hydrogenoxidans]|uniref:Nodulation protein NfeD n=1 Tax=Spectribacter hydrogenoxidans TaxID=3075608 RepID=A0ABU3C1X0_9GAMM|nr:nodulation protein NfeD [Salinisphaera sp. W335]MDT0635545.1 nodulation protein NfeD [Salinisphaera sp. W335]